MRSLRQRFTETWKANHILRAGLERYEHVFGESLMKNLILAWI